MISLDSHRTASGLVDHVNVTESHLPLYGSESHANGFDPWSGTTYRPLRVRRSGWSTGLRGRPYGDMKKPAEFNTPQNPAQRVMYSAGFSFPHTPDRKSIRLNSSHVKISYAVFCLKKKKQRPATRLHDHRYRRRPP